MARKRKSTLSRFSWRHTRQRKSVQEVSSSTNYSSTSTRQTTSSQVISPFKASYKKSFKSPYKSPFKTSLNGMSPLDMKSQICRYFAYCTSKRKVYETVDESCVCDSDGCNEFCRICSNERQTLPSDIILRNHPFDSAVRKRLAGRRKIDHIPSEGNAVLRGCLGVRWEKARCKMSKMLTCKRMGIDEL